MKFAIKSISAAAVIALCPLAPAAARSADEAAQTSEAPTNQAQGERVRSTMNQVFGAGRWRQTSGYRSRAREDELRREGAGTVPAGHLSHHSMGSPDAPGAYDIVVPGMSYRSAAAKLRASGEPFSKVIAEGAHGAQGPHLHVEPGMALVSNTPPKAVADADSNIYLRIVGGKRNPLLARR